MRICNISGRVMLNVQYIVIHSMLYRYHPVPIATKRFTLILVPFTHTLTHTHTHSHTTATSQIDHL